MPVTDLLRRNAREHGDEVALIELNPAMEDTRKISFKEFDLVQQTKSMPYRHEITWQIFDEKSNRVANMLLGRGIKKGDKVAILMFNCLEWLPIYFGILKTGAIAVPFNFRYTANEISYCADLAEISVMFFGSEFVDRLNINADEIAKDRLLLYVGDGQAPEFAENYWQQVADYSSRDPMIELTEEDYAAIYFSSGTTGFPKAILHPHRSLTQAAEMEAVHHQTGKNDCFLCIPPLYHTGAKFHWMGSLWTCSKAVLLKGTKPEVILKAASDEQCTIVSSQITSSTSGVLCISALSPYLRHLSVTGRITSLITSTIQTTVFPNPPAPAAFTLDSKTLTRSAPSAFRVTVGSARSLTRTATQYLKARSVSSASRVPA